MTSADVHFLEQVESIDQKINCCIKEVSKLLQNVDALGETFKSHAFDDNQSKLIGELLNYLISSIHTYRGIEEFITPHIGELRRQNELALIPTFCKACQCDEEEIIKLSFLEQNSQLWEKLCFHLEDYLLKKLCVAIKQHCMSSESIVNWLLLQNYIDLLKSIHTPSVVWDIYKNFRFTTLMQYKCSCVGDSPPCFCCFVNLCVHCICEDMTLIYTGHFHPLLVTWSNVLQMYVEAVEQNLFDVLDSLDQWMKARTVPPSPFLPLISSNFPWKKIKYFKTCITCWIEEGIVQESLNILKSSEQLSNDTSFTQLCETCDSAYTLIILRIIETLYLFEVHLSTLFRSSSSNKEAFHKHPVDLPFLSEGMNFTLPMDSPDPSPLHQPHSSLEDEAVVGSWNWRAVISERGYLTHLQRALQKNVQTVISDSIKEEWRWLMENGGKSTSLSGVICKMPSCCEQASSVFSSAIKAVKETEKFMPIMIASEGPLCPFKSSFSHTINSYFFDLIKHIESIANQVPTKFSIYCLYVSASSALFLRNRVIKYTTLVAEKNEETGSSLSNVCYAVSQLADNLVENIFFLHMKYISCGLLLDAGSHDWQNLKPFYEGERVSYSIQMWNFYMAGLLNDLRFYLPQQFAQDLYTRILSESLTHFLLHYSHVSPSETRVNQAQADIVTILLCTSEILYPACSSVAELIGKLSQENKSDTAGSLVNKIHSSCCTLLCTMAVLTSPLPKLYSVFKNGFPHTSLMLRTKYDFVSPWLPWIRTTLFPESGRGPLMSNVAVWLAVQICTSWFQPNPLAILKAFTVHHCTLSILLITQATYIPSDATKAVCDNSSSMASKDPKLLLAKSVFQLLLCVSHHPNYLTDVLLPVIERTDGWKEFDQSAFNKELNQRPWWYLGLVFHLKPFIESVIQGAMPSMIQRQKLMIYSPVSDQWKSLKDKFASCISCTCEDDISGSVLNETTLPLQCITEILSSLDNYVTVVPLPLRCCLSSLDMQLLNYVHDSEPVQHSLPLQVLLSILCVYLRDSDLMKLCLGHDVSNECELICNMVGDAMESIIKESQCISSLPTPFSTLIAKQILHIKQHFDDLRDEPESAYNLKDGEELEDEALQLSAVELAQQPNGEETIFYLQMLLCRNTSWIQLSLGVPYMLSSDSVVSSISPSPLSDQGNSDTPDFSNEKTYSANSKQPFFHHNLKSATACSSAETNYSQETPVRYDDNQRQHVDALIGKMQWNEMNSTQVTSQHSLNLDLDLSSFAYSSKFNPFDCFERLGGSLFNEKNSMEFPIAWEALLSHLPVLGLTECGFCTLLSQRWDIRNENLLSQDEKGYVQELKVKYKLSDSTSCSSA